MGPPGSAPRQPINELVTGVVSRIDGLYAFAAESLAEGEAIATGEIFLRYAIPYFFEADLFLVPELLVLDRGETLSGEDAWDFLMRRSHLYPRADALGRRRDGVDAMTPLKQLDFDSPYAVYAYREPTDEKPIAELSALIAADTSSFPERLLAHLPVYATVVDWRAHG